MGHHASDKQRFASFVVALLLLISARGQQAAAAAPVAPVADDALAHDAWRVLTEKCLACHGGDGKKFKSGLDLRTRQSALKGGERGPALVPGDPAQSLIYRAVTRVDEDLSMPPKEKDKLAAEQVELINKWIAAGAPWPEEIKVAVATTKATTRGWADADGNGVVVATSGGLAADWDQRKYKPEDLWAYQPVKRHAVPTRPM